MIYEMNDQRDFKGTLLFRYGTAIVLGVAALVIMRFFETEEEVTALQIPLVAVTLSSLFFGFFPGVLTALICSFAGAYLYLEPAHNMFIADHGETLHWWLFNVLALLMASITARLRSALIQNRRLRIQYESLYEEAKKAVKAREEVLAIVSHDLRNDLGSIMMNSELLLRNTNIDPKRPAAMIKRSGEQMNGLIENLLSLAKIDSGHLTLELSSHNARGLVDEALELVSPLAGQKSIQIQKQLLNDDVQIDCDQPKVIRIFSNLLGNSIKFMGKKGKIIISGKSEGDRYLFSVQDQGPGISEQDLPHIFDRFWQERKMAQKGTGLGLSIVKGIVEAHHGSVWVNSKFGEGSTFYFTLPLKQPRSETQPDVSNGKKSA